jgi:ribosomal protein RSM22 (predicted rRNA methylase)
LHSAKDLQLRRLSTTRNRAEEVHKDATPNNAATAAETEAVVRQARQTFGETLPKDYLSTKEYIIYERLYGPPSRDTRAEDLEYLPDGEEGDNVAGRNVLLGKNADGEYEEVEIHSELSYSVEDSAEETMEGTVEMEEAVEDFGGLVVDDIPQVSMVADDTEEQLIQVQGKNRREIDAIKRLQQDMDAAALAAEEEVEEEEEWIEEEEEEKEDYEEDYEDQPDAYLSSDEIRTHPHTMTGRSGTSPSTLSLPQPQLVEPISELLERTNWKHLIEASEKAFGGKGLPSSPATRTSMKNIPQKHIGLDAGQHRMSEVEADAYLAAVMPGTYATVMSTLVEVRKRLGSEWIRDLMFRPDGEGPRVLDAGGGGAGAIAWHEMLQAEWDVLKDKGIVEGDEVPTGKTTVLTGANTLRHRVSRFLDNTTFIPRLPDYVHAANSDQLLYGAPATDRKSYDVIIAPHTLLHLKEDFRRKNMVQNLWSLLDPNGGVLILIEKGMPRGFEAIAGARSLLLESHISSPDDTTIANMLNSESSSGAPFREKEDGMIIAPCTNHNGCPMYPIPGLSFGRKDFCHFAQRYIRPGFLQRVLGASARNHEDIKYSYIAVRRGVDARKTANPLMQGDVATEQSFEGYEDHDLPESEADSELEPSYVKFNSLSLPRLILPGLKRRGHVTLDLCTPSGKLERWTIPKSFSKVAYRDARKSKWGDLWALGAKTRVMRNPRLGRSHEEGEKKGKFKGVRDGKMGKGGKKMKKNKFNIIMGKDGMEGIEQDPSQAKYLRPGKRTKGGRFYKEPKPITEKDLG